MNINITIQQAETIYNALLDAKSVTTQQMIENSNNVNKVRMFKHQLKAIDEIIYIFQKIVK